MVDVYQMSKQITKKHQNSIKAECLCGLHPAQPYSPFSPMAFPNWMWRVSRCTCTHCIRKKAVHLQTLCLPAEQRYRELLLALPPLPANTHLGKKKNQCTKAPHSCSISSFTAGIIKSGFYRLFNPNSPCQLEVASSKSSAIGRNTSLWILMASYGGLVLIA